MPLRINQTPDGVPGMTAYPTVELGENVTVRGRPGKVVGLNPELRRVRVKFMDTGRLEWINLPGADGETDRDVRDRLRAALAELDVAENAESDEKVRQAWDAVPPGWGGK